MKSISLRLKLFATSVATIIVALALAGYFISSLFAAHVENNLKADLTDQFNRLAAQLDPTSETPTLRSPLANPSFNIPHGGYYWQITDPVTNTRARSRSMWDEQFDLQNLSVLDGRPHTIRIIDPEGTQAIALVQRLQFELPDNAGSRAFDIIVARDLVHFDIAMAKFRQDLFLSLAILAIILFIAAWIQISLGLAPFRAIRDNINAIRTGAAKRMDENHPPEVMPLINEMNEMLDNQEKSMTFARSRASNLAHSLKTHLSVLQSESEDLRAANLEKHADSIEKIGQDMHAIIDHQLRLSRLKTRSPADFFSTPLKDSVNRIVNALQRTPDGRQREFNIDIDPSIQVDMDNSDLIELLGIVLENATKWARTTVSISARRQEGENRPRILLQIHDDGPGLTAPQMARLGERGIRLDEQGTGTGIGLSIAREIMEKNHGTLEFSRAPTGGLQLDITLLSAR